MARPIAALWRAHANPRESRRGNQILSQTAIRPFCHMKKQHVNKTHPPHPISGREKGCETVEFTTKGTNQKCRCQLRGEPNGSTWAPVKIPPPPRISGATGLFRAVHALPWDKDMRRGILSGSPRLAARREVVGGVNELGGKKRRMFRNWCENIRLRLARHF